MIDSSCSLSPWPDNVLPSASLPAESDRPRCRASASDSRTWTEMPLCTRIKNVAWNASSTSCASTQDLACRLPSPSARDDGRAPGKPIRPVVSRTPVESAHELGVAHAGQRPKKSREPRAADPQNRPLSWPIVFSLLTLSASLETMQRPHRAIHLSRKKNILGLVQLGQALRLHLREP